MYSMKRPILNKKPRNSIEKLIREVKKHPCLYNRDLDGYKDTNSKELAWIAVAEILQQDPKALKNEWKKIRDCFREALKREWKSTTKQPDKPVIQWKYRRQMEFVLPFMNTRLNKPYLPQTSDAIQYDDESLVGKIEIQEDDDVDYTLPAKLSTSESERLELGEAENVVQYLTALQQDKEKVTCTCSESQRDPLYMFFASMCESTKRLPALYQNNIKRELFQAVMQAEEQYQLEQTSPLQYQARSATPWQPPRSSSTTVLTQESTSPSFTDGTIHVLKVVNS